MSVYHDLPPSDPKSSSQMSPLVPLGLVAAAVLALVVATWAAGHQRAGLRAEINGLRQQVEALRLTTNEVITIKIILPPGAKPASVEAERN